MLFQQLSFFNNSVSKLSCARGNKCNMPVFCSENAIRHFSKVYEFNKAPFKQLMSAYSGAVEFFCVSPHKTIINNRHAVFYTDQFIVVSKLHINFLIFEEAQRR